MEGRHWVIFGSLCFEFLGRRGSGVVVGWLADCAAATTGSAGFSCVQTLIPAFSAFTTSVPHYCFSSSFQGPLQLRGLGGSYGRGLSTRTLLPRGPRLLGLCRLYSLHAPPSAFWVLDPYLGFGGMFLFMLHYMCAASSCIFAFTLGSIFLGYFLVYFTPTAPLFSGLTTQVTWGYVYLTLSPFVNCWFLGPPPPESGVGLLSLEEDCFSVMSPGDPFS